MTTKMTTKKTNLRLEEMLYKAVMDNLDNGETFSRFVRDSLNEYLRKLRLRPNLIARTEYLYITKRTKLPTTAYISKLRNVNVRLYLADVDFCRLSSYDITKTVRLSAIAELNRRIKNGNKRT